ncbi:hypothetical protein M513_10971 [Trichuris suis]|uniref:PI3K/PI4K catalytic domain-containing protein n=1 Tax=Trichuris suis TaxID=68888 RepID=A0A085LT37_9BILA|nr:hypothetical protein M513_10971 [Trichuris suis]
MSERAITDEIWKLVRLLGSAHSSIEQKTDALQRFSEPYESLLTKSWAQPPLRELHKKFESLLDTVPPGFVASYARQTLRYKVLSLIAKWPLSDSFAHDWASVAKVLVKVYKTDNVENGLIALKLFRNCVAKAQASISQQIRELLTAFKDIYQQLPTQFPQFMKAAGSVCEAEGDIDEEDFINLTVLPGLASDIRVHKKNKKDYTVWPKCRLALRGATELTYTIITVFEMDRKLLRAEMSSMLCGILKVLSATVGMDSAHAEQNTLVLTQIIKLQYSALQFILTFNEEIVDFNKKAAEGLPRSIFNIIASIPSEETQLRKDMILVLRKFSKSSMRCYFVGVMNDMLEEGLLLGRGYTSNLENRSYFMATIGDFLHYLRFNLKPTTASKAVQMFARYVQDPKCSPYLQTAVIGVINSVLEGMAKNVSDQSRPEASLTQPFSLKWHHLLLFVLEVVLGRLKMIVNEQLPRLLKSSNKSFESNDDGAIAAAASLFDSPRKLIQKLFCPEALLGDQPSSTSSLQSILKEDEDEALYFDAKVNSVTFTIVECQQMINAILGCCRTVIWILQKHHTDFDKQEVNLKVLRQKEVELLILIFKNGLVCLDAFSFKTISFPVKPNAMRNMSSKEEKDFVEQFSLIFSNLHVSRLFDVLNSSLDFVVQRIVANKAAMSILTLLFSNRSISSLIMSVVLNYLSENIEVLAETDSKASVHVKLFQLCLSTVGGSGSNDGVFKVCRLSTAIVYGCCLVKLHLKKLVNATASLARRSEHPANALTVLRHLLRTVCNHQAFAQDIASLVFPLLKVLNEMHHFAVRPDVKDSLLELCLSMPARLSTVRPYLSLLMEPIVVALDHSMASQAQAIRCLELCIDAVPSDYLIHAIRPIRVRLLRSLWRILRSYAREQLVHAAWRCISKLGGENRNLLRDPEMVEESILSAELPQVVFFGPYDPMEGSSAPRFRISLPKIVENCCSLLSRQQLDIPIKRHAVATLHVYVRLSFGLSMEWTGQEEDNSGQTESSALQNVTTDSDLHKTFSYADSNNWLTTAVVGLFVAAADQDELSEKVAAFLKALTRKCALETLCGCSDANRGSANLELMLKAIFRVLKSKSEQVYPTALSCLKSCFEIAYERLGDWEKVMETPFARYVTEAAMTLCLSNRHEAKIGSCFALNCLLEILPTDWALKNLERIFSCIISVQNEIDVETCGIAKRHAAVTLENLMNKISSELAREDSCPTEVASVVRLAIRHMVSCIPSIRETAMSAIRSLSNSSRISVVSLLLAERAVIDEIFEVPSCRIDLKSVPAQIAYLEGLTFICKERQPIFSFGDSPEVVNFLLRIAALLGMDDSPVGGEDDFLLHQRRQPKGVPTILRWETVHLTNDLRLAALKALYTIYKFVSDRTQQILANLLLNNVVGTHEPLQREAFTCLKQLMEQRMVNNEILRSADQRLSRLYGSVRKWSLKEVRQVNYLVQLCRSHMPVAVQQLIVEYLKKFTVDMESNLTLVASEHTACDSDRKVLDGVIEIFCHLSSVDGSTVDALAELVLEMETKIEKCTVNPLRQSFLSFAEKFPSQVVEWFLIKNGLKGPSVIYLYTWLLKQRGANCFRNEISNQSNVLLQLMSSANLLKSQLLKDREIAMLEIEAAVIYSFWKLSKTNDTWLLEHPVILEEVRKLWNSPSFAARYGSELAYFSFWKVPRWMVKIMLVYFRADPSNINFLLELLSCLNSKFLCNFEFFRHYLREELATTGSIEWKRSLFFRFLHSWSPNTPKMNTLLILLREVILPSFLVSFEKGEAEQLIQGPSEAAGAPDSNIVYVFAKSFVENHSEQKRPDALQLALFQLSIMFVKYAPCHIFDPSNRNGEGKNSPNLLRPFLVFGWSYMEDIPPKDPLLRCHGQVLVAFIVWKFNVKTFVIQQMLPHLVSTFAKEPRPINSQVLSITLRAVLRQEEEGRKQLLESLKESLLANHSELNCYPETFMLFLRFPQLCFSLRHELMPFLVLTVSAVLHSSSLDAFDTKKAAFEVINLVMKWEIARRKLSYCDDGADGTATSKEASDFEKEHLNSLVYALLHQWTMLQQRMQALSKVSGSPHSVVADLERLSMQCTSVIKRMLSEELFGNTVDLNLHTWLLDVLLSSKNASNSDEDAISAHLELLAIVFGFLPFERVVPTLRTVADGIAACLHSTRPKAVCSTVKVLTKLHCVFALADQDFSTVLSETFCPLKTELVSVLSHEIATLSNSRIINRFISLLKNVSSTGSSLTITFAEPLVNAMEQLARLNLNQATPEGKRRGELLMWCLDITKSMVQLLSLKLQKKLVQNVLTVLVENMESFRVLGTVILLVDHWIQVTGGSVGKGELTLDFQIFLLKLVTCVDQKVPLESEVRKVHYLLVERIKKCLPGLMVELNDKVMGGILAGLASQDEELRASLFAIYNRDLPRTAYERLFHMLTYIIWEPLQQYNWVKQCVELMLSCVEMDQPLCLAISSPSSSNASTVEWSTSAITAKDFLPHLFYLNHGSDIVAHSIWVDCFKSLWSSFSVAQKEGISRALNYFLLNGSHTALRDSSKHVIRTLVDALRGLEPHVDIDPSTYRYVGKAQNAWHTCALLLEEMTAYCGPSPMQAVAPFSRVEQLEVLDAFSNLLSALGESDLSTAVWMRKSSDEALRQGMLWDQHGQYEKSRDHYFNTIKLREQSEAWNSQEPGRWVFDHHEMVEHFYWLAILSNLTTTFSFYLFQPFYSACEQLGKWKDVHDLSMRPPEDPMHALESSWRIDNLENVQSCFETIENNCPKEWLLKLALYRGYLSFRTSEQQDGAAIHRNVQSCISLLIKEGRCLPSVFGPGHLKLLRLGQLVLELSEASEYHIQFLRLTSGHQPSTVDLKNLQRLWGNPLRNETSILCDDAIHVSSVLTWRIRYLSILESLTTPTDLRSTQRISDMKGKALLVAARAARKLKMLSFADDCLGNFRVLHYAIPKDVGTWIKECALMQVAKARSLRSVNEMAYPLLQATLMINEADHDFIPAENNAELFSVQGVMYSMLKQDKLAEELFTYSSQINPNYSKNWKNWGIHLESAFLKNRNDMSIGIEAIVRLLNTAISGSEWKVRKCMASVFYLLHFDDDKDTLKIQFLLKALQLEARHFVFWLPQLFDLLCVRKFFIVANLIGHVAKEFPESVLCHLQIYRSSAGNGMDEEVAAALEKVHKHIAITYPVLSSAFADFSKRLIYEVASEDSMERLLRQVYDLIECIYDAAFLHQNDSLESEMTNVFSLLSSVRQTLATSSSADNFPESWAQAACDLETVLASAGNVSSIIHAAVVLKNAITTHWQSRNHSIPLIDRSAQLSLFTVGVAELDVPHMWISPMKSAFRPKIARVLPGFDIVTYGNVVCKRVHISGTDGKVYSYMLIENESLKNVQSKCRLSQCFHGFNKLLRQDQDSVSRNLQFDLPDAIPLGPNHTLILCSTQTKSMLSLFAEAFQRVNHSLDDLVVGYYAGMENWERTNKLYHAALRKAYKSVQDSLVVKNAFKEQMLLRYPVAADYFSFRKQVCYDVGLLNFAQYFLFLSPFYLEHLMISMSSGFVSTFHQLFDFNQAGELNQNRPIPFRLTPCISEFLAIGIQGYSLPAMVAGARVLQSHSCVEWIRLFLQSEHILKLPNMSEDCRQQLIAKNLKAIEGRLHELANVGTGDSRAMTLIGSAQAVDNLCRMNPSWFPWL